MLMWKKRDAAGLLDTLDELRLGEEANPRASGRGSELRLENFDKVVSPAMRSRAKQCWAFLSGSNAAFDMM